MNAKEREAWAQCFADWMAEAFAPFDDRARAP
jgi:hypothetical protein